MNEMISCQKCQKKIVAYFYREIFKWSNLHFILLVRTAHTFSIGYKLMTSYRSAYQTFAQAEEIETRKTEHTQLLLINLTTSINLGNECV